MIKTYTSEHFKQVPWKNGKGITTELAISENNKSDKFQWRISIANMNETMFFSTFEGYHRDLVLLEGTHLNLEFENETIELKETLDAASFDGGSRVNGILNKGNVRNFNLMTLKNVYQTKVVTYNQEHTIETDDSDLCFIYAIDRPLFLYNQNNFHVTEIEKDTLVQINDTSSVTYNIRGSNYILIYLLNR